MFNSSTRLSLSLLAIAIGVGACSNPPPPTVPPSPQAIASPSPTPDPPVASPSPTLSPPDSSKKNNVKVFFPKTPKSNEDFSYVEPVWRGTNSAGVAKFALEQLIAGPTSAEQQLGLKPAIQLQGSSNCGGDFKISIVDKVAQLQLCRSVVSAGVGDDARAISAMEATLKQFPSVDSAIIRDRDGNCFGDASGENACLTQGTQPLNNKAKLALASLGPVRVGTTIEDATQAAGIKFIQKTSGGEEYDCLYYEPEGEPQDIALMVTEGQIARIDINSKNITTLSGAKIGDREETIRQLYPGQIEAQPHPYISGGKYLIFVPQDDAESNYRLIFETDADGVVRSFRSGQLPEVRYIEGCL